MRPISLDIGMSGGSASAVGILLTGRSLVMEVAREQLRALAAVPWHGRIEGPRGAGKHLAAGLVHSLSRRVSRPFVRQSMSALVRGLEFGRLFGWSRGGFTGAVRDVPGVLEEANQGTLFLDEIAWARRRVQGALLQLLEDGEVVRIGERRARKLDVRFLFGTNVDLDAEAATGRFPADLLDRMGALVVRMPALKDHIEDLPELVDTILPSLAAEIGIPPRAIAPADVDRLMAYSWPGNVRQLQNALKVYLTVNAWPPVLSGAELGEREVLLRALADARGNKRKVARRFGVTPRTLYRRLERAGLADR